MTAPSLLTNATTPNNFRRATEEPGPARAVFACIAEIRV
jgi:hypothetical protein